MQSATTAPEQDPKAVALASVVVVLVALGWLGGLLITF